MTYDIIFISNDSWFLLGVDTLVEIPAWSKVDGPVVMVADFHDVVIGLHRFEGKPAHASAVIAKQVRTEGLIDGSVHISLHQVSRLADGCLAFYSALPLELWQRIQQWISGQKDHCLFVSLADLLVCDLEQGRARVLRIGRTLHLCGFNEQGFFYASISAGGKSQEDLKTAIKALCARNRGELAKGVKSPVGWGCLQGGAIELEREYAEVFAKSSHLECALIEHRTISSWDQGVLSSALPALCKKIKAFSVHLALFRRLAWLSEVLVVPAAAATAIVGICLAIVGSFALNRAHLQVGVTQQINTEATKLEARIAAANEISTPADFSKVAGFVRVLGDAAVHDPVSMLRLVREAAGQDIRIKRVKLESTIEKKRYFRIDGVADKSGLNSVSQFLAHLQAAGWKAESLAPFEQLSGSFSYRLFHISPPTT